MRTSAQLAVTLVLAIAAGGVALAQCEPLDPERPRTLIIALDGVPLRVVEQARARGIFEGWSTTVPLVSTFPSLTNVAFSAMLEPVGAAPARGYEVRYFDREQNAVVGGSPFGYGRRTFDWRNHFDVTGTTVKGKLAVYTSPRRNARKVLRHAEQQLLESDDDPFLVHVGATDAMVHLRGDEPLVDLLGELESRLDETRRLHREQRGRSLRVVLLSDHGNTTEKIRPVKKLRRRLRHVGLRPVERLRRPGDVVAVSFGLVSYGALYLESRFAEVAASAIAGHDAIELTAWLSGENEITVLSSEGRARIAWRDEGGKRRIRYEHVSGDPLRLAGSEARMSAADAFDAEGFADRETWLAETALEDFPDALGRLADGLTASYVQNLATMLFSMRSGYAWGWRSAHASSWLKGGHLEGTHGGLDRDSSLGFFLTDDPTLRAPAALRIESVMAHLAVTGSCSEDPALQTGY